MGLCINPKKANMAGRPLSPTSLRVLLYIATHPEGSPTQIAKTLRLNYRTVASIVRRHSGKVRPK